MYQSCHRYTTKCTKWKAPISEKLLQNGKNMQTRTYYARSAYRKTCRGVANCWKLFQVGQRIPRQIIWTYLSLSASTLNMTELTLRHPQDNSVKILWPIQTQQGNQYRQNYVTVTYVLWEQMNRHTVDLGFIQSRAEVTTVFTNVDKWITAVFVNGLGMNKRKDRRKG